MILAGSRLYNIVSKLSGSCGADSRPIYLKDGLLKASDGSIGSSTKPVYLNAGVITACDVDLSGYITDEALQAEIDDEAEAREDADEEIKTELEAHIADKDNPHSVTAEQLGLASAYKYKGSVDNYSGLPENAETGDVYNVTNADTENGIKTGDNVAWNGESWDNLSGVFDTSELEAEIAAAQSTADKAKETAEEALAKAGTGASGDYLPLAGGTMTGDIVMGSRSPGSGSDSHTQALLSNNGLKIEPDGGGGSSNFVLTNNEITFASVDSNDISTVLSRRGISATREFTISAPTINLTGEVTFLDTMYGTEDIGEGATLTTGKMYLVYED